MSDEKILKRDDKLLKNEKSWRRGRIGVIFFAFAFISFTIFAYIERDKEGTFVLVGWTLFWVILADWLNLKLHHIESIKLYRSKIKEEIR